MNHCLHLSWEKLSLCILEASLWTSSSIFQLDLKETAHVIMSVFHVKLFLYVSSRHMTSNLQNKLTVKVEVKKNMLTIIVGASTISWEIHYQLFWLSVKQFLTHSASQMWMISGFFLPLWQKNWISLGCGQNESHFLDDFQGENNQQSNS